jgi:putative hydrolase of the HAD superfamily
VVQAGGWGVYVPHGLVWEIEHAPAPESSARYREIPDLGSLPKLVQDIEGS